MKKKRTLLTKPNSIYGPLLIDQSKGQAVDADLMDKLYDQLVCAERDNNRKLLFYRMDLRFPKDMAPQPDNMHFRHFMSSYCKNLSRQGYNPRYAAVREQKDSDKPHYHVAMFLDGHKAGGARNHLNTAERLWEAELGVKEKDGEEKGGKSNKGLVDRCDDASHGRPLRKNEIHLDQYDTCEAYDYDDERENLVRRLSYLAKPAQKDDTPEGKREYFSSKLLPEYAKEKKRAQEIRKKILLNRRASSQANGAMPSA